MAGGPLSQTMKVFITSLQVFVLTFAVGGPRSNLGDVDGRRKLGRSWTWRTWAHHSFI